MLIFISYIGSVNWQGSTCAFGKENADILYTPFTQFYRVVLRGNFVTGSTSLAATGNGSITISSIPPGSNIVRAFLFWVEEDQNNASSGNFNGNPITGIKIAEDCTACWGTPRNALFYSDVTAYVTGNGTYSLSSFNPLACALGDDGIEGATLVVIWCNNSQPVRTITIYTGDVETPASICIYSNYSWTHTNFTASNPVLDASYSILLGNGQDFSEGVGEYVYLNGNMITNMVNGTTGPAGPCNNGSLWDEFKGSATSWILPNSTSATFSVNNAVGWDCWHPVVSVLSVTSTDPITQPCGTPINVDEKMAKPYIKISGNIIEISSNSNFAIFSLRGDIIGRYEAGSYKLKLKDGIYLLKYDKGVEKILIGR